jgi:hypothetical protein
MISLSVANPDATNMGRASDSIPTSRFKGHHTFKAEDASWNL